MSWADRISMLVAAAANSGHARSRNLLDQCPFNDVNARFDDANRRIDDLQSRSEACDDLQADIRELRSLLIEAIKDGTPADAAGDN